MKSKKIAIIQISPPRTASTLLMNAILGLINQDIPVYFINLSDIKKDKKEIPKLKKHFGNLIILKTHIGATSIQKAVGKWRRLLFGYKCYFISSERKDLNRLINIDNERVLIFPYEVLLETPLNSLKNIIDNLHTEISNFLPTHIKLNKDSCYKRLEEMNKLVLSMQNKNFNEFDDFYGIHGGHRNRGERNIKDNKF